MARLIAIDLGADAVKVTVFQGATGSAALQDEVVRRVPQDASGSPSLADRLAILDLVLKDHPDWTSGSHLAGLVWPSSRVSVRRMQLPFTDKAQVEQTLPFAVEAEVPFDLDEMVLAWRPIDDAGSLLVTLASKEALGEAIAGLAARGLDPKHVLADGGLLAHYAAGDAVTAVVDVGADHATVVVARNGTALFYRSVGVAGRAFTRAIADALGCSWAEAELLKHGGLPDDGPAADDLVGGPMLDEFDTDVERDLDEDESTSAHAVPTADVRLTPDGVMPEKARSALHAAVGLLLAEVRTTLVQAEDDLGLGVDEVVLTGGGSRIPELRGWLEEDLGLPVRHPVDEAGTPVRDETAVGRALGPRIAADALEDVTDLRVGDLAWRGGIGRVREWLRYGGFGLAAYVVVLLAITGFNVWTYHKQRGELDARIRAALVEVAPDAPEDLDATGANALIAELVDEARTEVEFLGEPDATPPTVDLIYQLTKGFPPHPDVVVNVDELDIQPGAIQISGVTDGFAQVDKIGQSLEESGAFPKVVATPGSKDRDGKLEFTVDISREEVVGEDGLDGGDSDVAPAGEEG